MSEPTKTDTAQAVRASISFPPADYEDLERIARQKRVSVAWVVREAVKQYLDAESPLFRKPT